MTTLFGRQARITVSTLVINLDELAFSFSVEASTASTPNKASIKVYNLSPNNRLFLSSLTAIPVRIEAGYKDAFGVIFEGTLRTVVHSREDGDILTEISAGDGEAAYRASRCNIQVPPGASVSDVAKQLVQAMGLGLGNVPAAFADLQLISGGKVYPTGRAIHGNAAREFSALCKACGAEWSSQRQQVQVLTRRGKGQGIQPKQAITLKAGTGLVGAPTINSTGLVQCKSLLIPTIAPGVIIVVEGEFVKGQCVVQSVKYNGSTYSDEWYCEIEAKNY